jgi:hypothetical protein
MKKTVFPVHSIWLGLFCGLVAGIGFRFTTNSAALGNALTEMTLGFIFLAPFAVGVVTVALMKPGDATWLRAVFWPWLPLLAGILIAWMFKWEGLICIVMFIPVGLVMSSLGGIVAKGIFKRKTRPLVLASFVFLPLASQLVEHQLPLPLAYHEVKSQVLIHARPEDVWSEIKSVRTIERPELSDSWVHKIGFPRPLRCHRKS